MPTAGKGELETSGIGPAGEAPAEATVDGGTPAAGGTGVTNCARAVGVLSGKAPPGVPGKHTHTLWRLTQTAPARSRRERRCAVKTQLGCKTLFYSMVGTQLGCKTLFYSMVGTQLGCKTLFYSMVGTQLGCKTLFYSWWESSSAQPPSAKGGGSGSPVGASVREGGWKVGVRAAGPAPRAPTGTAVGETTEPPGNDPPPSLPGPDASSHLEAMALSTQSSTAGAEGALAYWQASAR